MASKHKIAEKFAQPIAQILYQRGFRRIDEMMEVVSSCINFCPSLSSDEKDVLIGEIEEGIKEYQYD